MSRLVLVLFTVMLIGLAVVLAGKSTQSETLVTIGQAIVSFVVVVGLTSLFRWLKRLLS